MRAHESLAGRDQLLHAISEVLTDFENGAEDWEHNGLDGFLEAWAALLGSIENGYTNTDRPVPMDPWQIVADSLRGARYYE